jgi:hypothetical protein
MSEPPEDDLFELLKRKPGGLYLQSIPGMRQLAGIAADTPEGLARALDLIEGGMQLGQAELAGVIEQSYLTARDIARSYGVQYHALRKRLERYRRNGGTGWKEAEDRTTRSERYLYLVSAVWPIIQSTPGARPAGASMF